MLFIADRQIKPSGNLNKRETCSSCSIFPIYFPGCQLRKVQVINQNVAVYSMAYQQLWEYFPADSKKWCVCDNNKSSKVDGQMVCGGRDSMNQEPV